MIAQVHALDATTIATGAPIVDTATIAQVHALSATEMATGAPTTGRPVLVMIVVGLIATGRTWIVPVEVRRIAARAERRDMALPAESRTTIVEEG